MTTTLMRTCSFVGCERVHRRNGWCDSHDQQFKKHGVEGMAPIGTTPRRPRGKYIRSNSYTAVHKRMSKWKGPASQQQCHGCGNDAKDWAYKGSCDDPQFEAHPRTGVLVEYSSSVDDYIPLCRGCHTAMDRYESYWTPFGFMPKN